MKKKVVVGMSGGVDSSVAALLLKEQGLDVIGVTMQIWQEEDAASARSLGRGDADFEPRLSSSVSCCGISAVEDARRVADVLGIPHYVMNFRREFRRDVIDYFIREYERGRTPNPCIACNRYVKWQSLLARSLAIGADSIATGHYARVVRLENGRWTVKTAASLKKDQTYALVGLTQEELAHTLMPVGNLSKDRVREIAEENSLPVAKKPDSEDVCFVPDGDYASFIENDTGRKGIPGNFVDEEGHILGRHRGIIHYTVGQRRGLNLPMGKRIFVKEIRPETNEVVLSDNASLFQKEVRVHDITFMGLPDLPMGARVPVFAKIRYNHRGASAIIERTGADEILCTFDEPQRAVTPGQAAVFYVGDYLAGGGTI